uniref:Plastid light harvesting protein n=1 Tax=Corethron hystrix TaxID=216773 RepID=A0A7S1B8J0_9STRA|mmetsp:Transcript_17026/g.38326  ORF Transcript_17026/g.38326 Transcript_17026/m.38326 type:complete len:228 (+) Transcript_17026:70-753(+)|eukprot:CAMPEP_0113314480 /NCGR_PEP_ID=MMETSP0010_2-20120614/10522_1 /TAXON_ID=216773 ORGANISM="Corethron hystrix, Strain 308" /NCGR_SAMPLE_ID=MMETSP0010_2 /ASSEMBLY_ACC=CAM_ASM_000155 /LENGTH=227 /DNA_ID=CAMNT_0000170771 /DNA_START=70 /DNA_END=753 /DNA_ORIENTATION=+ /assembly_acc=CAM_ASM_000155
MKTFALTALFVGVASAFAPQATTRSSTAIQGSLDGTFGVGIEFGNKCPPLGQALLDDATPDAVAWFQNAEIKHGRVAMVATIGFMIQKWGVHMPLYLGPSGSNVFHPEGANNWMLSSSAGVSFGDIAKLSPLDAVAAVPIAGWLQVLFAAGAFEAVAYHRQYNLGGRVPGDYGYDPLGFTKCEGGLESDKMKSMRMKEIKNGRVAMMAIAGWVSSEAIPGSFPVWHP